MSSSKKYLFFICLLFLLSIFFLFTSQTVEQISAGCSGTIKCGAMAYRCNGNMANCAYPGDPVCIGHGTCQLLCDVSLLTNLCSGLTQSSCETVTPADCASGCSINPDDTCTWIPPCTFTAWTDGACDDGDCTPTQRRQYRIVTPAGCTNSTRCVEDPTCTGGGGGTPPPVTPTPPPGTTTCEITMLPNPVSLSIGEIQNMVATIIPSDGTIRAVYFNPINTSIVSVNPDRDFSSTYQTNATGVSSGNTTMTTNVTMNDLSGNNVGIKCTFETSFTVTLPGPWWQVKDGDVTSNGDITSSVPSGSNFDTIGTGGYPGVPAFGGSLGVGSGTISTTLWNANTSTSQGRLFDYSYFESLIPDDVTFNDVSILSTGAGATIYDGYEWYKFDGTTGATLGQNMDIASSINFAGRKVILFVKGANLNINGNINLTDGVGFFGTFVNGDININPTVTQLEGIYLTDTNFITGVGSSALWVRGSVGSYGGISLGRDLTNDTTPAELFEYGPDQVLLFPNKLAFRRTKWIEVAP